jgi:hypothetical protein
LATPCKGKPVPAGIRRCRRLVRLDKRAKVPLDLFRQGLLEYWDGRCAITGIAIPELLRASHIKPWADCETDAERLDVFNGLLLAPHLDAVFDQGFITVADDGEVLVSKLLGSDERRLLALGSSMKVRMLSDGHRRYLSWHVDRVFKGPGATRHDLAASRSPEGGNARSGHERHHVVSHAPSPSVRHGLSPA